MNKPIAHVAIAFTISLASAGAQQTSAADAVARAQQDIASLIPADAAAVVRLTSIELLLQCANELSKAAGKESKLTAERLLGQIGLIPGKRELIDLQLPVVLAVSLPRATPPAPVLLLPVTDATAYAASLVELGMSPVVEGRYVAVPLAGKYVKPAAPSKALAQLPQGTFAVYADAEKMVAAFGTVIGATLSAGRVQLARQLERTSPGVDGETLADAYLDGLRAVLGCAKACRFSADYRDGKLDLFATLQVKAGSDMDGWSSPPVAMAAAGNAPTGHGAFETVLAADKQKLWPRLMPLLTRVAEAYPMATADALILLAADWLLLHEALGPLVALDGDLFAADGMRVTMRAAPADVGALRNAIDALCSRDKLGTSGITVAAPRTTEASGAMITDRDVAFDLTKLAGVLDMQLAGMGSITSERMLQAVFGGAQIPLRVATKNGRAVVAVGRQPDTATMAALDDTAQPWSKPVQQALARVADCNPFAVQRIDFGVLFAGFTRLVHELDETVPIPELPADATASFVFAVGIKDAEWRAGVSIDAAGAATIAAAMQPR